jgi:hypothetical protein
MAGCFSSFSHLVRSGISETHSVVGELLKVSTICKSINRAMIVLDYYEGEGIRKVAGNAICLQ